MNTVQIGQNSYEMPPREGISVAHFLTVADIESGKTCGETTGANKHTCSMPWASVRLYGGAGGDPCVDGNRDRR
jgi:hypothetical protein